MKALFKRVAMLEESTRKTFSNLWYAIKKNTEALRILEETTHEKDLFKRLVAKDVKNAPRIKND